MSNTFRFGISIRGRTRTDFPIYADPVSQELEPRVHRVTFVFSFESSSLAELLRYAASASASVTTSTTARNKHQTSPERIGEEHGPPRLSVTNPGIFKAAIQPTVPRPVTMHPASIPFLDNPQGNIRQEGEKDSRPAAFLHWYE